MFELLSTAGNLPVDAIGWLVLLLSLLVAVIWVLYLYR